MGKYAYVVNLERCMGCAACVEACKIENNTGQGMFWMYLFRLEQGKYPDSYWSFLPRPCMHCNNPPCVKVCPVQARYKREDGFVLTNFERCIGCRICVVSCPYGVNYFNWKHPKDNQYFDWNPHVAGHDVYGKGSVINYTRGAIPPYKNPDHERRYGPEQRLVSGGGHYSGTVEKCTWCVHRVEKGLLPACVTSCPVGALAFGDRTDPNSEVSRLLAKKQGFQLLEEIGTKPSVYYVGRPQPQLHGEKLTAKH